MKQEIKDDIIKYYAAGATYAELGREYGFSQATVGKICREAGVNRRMGRPSKAS
jgi:AcrR family transcriptional regulator